MNTTLGAYLLGDLPVEPARPSNVRVILRIDRCTCAGRTPDQGRGHLVPPPFLCGGTRVSHGAAETQK